MRKRILVLFLAFAVTGLGVWALLYSGALKWHRRPQSASLSNPINNTVNDPWAEALEKVKADRGEPAGTSAHVEIPTELQHYSDRHWFLASQVAEVGKYNIQTSQDFVDLAAMIQRGEMVAVPAVTDTYVLLGVGAKADEGVISRYKDGHSIELYNEAQLGAAYRRLDDKRSTLQSEIDSYRAQSGRLKKNERTRRAELQKEIAARQQELNSTNKDKALLDQSYGNRESRQKLFRDYESLQELARNLAGRSYDISSPSDREAMKVSMLSSLRPEALKLLEEIASGYHRQFDRPLPVSSLVRPEEYQRALNKVNRNAVLIDTPPHSTGLAFDIDYRYLSAAEQTFLMVELARLKTGGRIEAIRERNANFHVFAFIHGTRPGDQLIAASLDKASVEVPKAHHASKQPVRTAKAKSQSQKAKSRRAKSKARKRR
jgi:hypothetical protein